MRIDDMKPGPELDRICGEVVFNKSGLELSREFLPAYSTSWEGMRLVVEEMQRRGWDYRIESYRGDVSFAFLQREHEGYSEEVGTELPYIATLAAIKALQGSEYDGTD
ncbi:hypothetical protein D7M11_02090 [Paenibacillus ginsengarvi]|uniref:Phage ABA sandwich domain-containing protein n=1 Tax=Paenibacillus ginsengarvi TaxID=400777 RepID=A0A3B0CSB5_9BACL|nr:hypothetical protein D7M11_02090 [Paenibacillus ginsengarvi]